MEQFCAHISEDDPRRVQTIKEHSLGVARLSGDFAAVFGAREQGELCGLAHDMGKYSDEFQRHIHGVPMQVDHATRGGQHLFGQQAIAPSFCVMGHHGGLPDLGVPLDKPDDPTFCARLKKTVPSTLEREQELSIPKISIPPENDYPRLAFFTRMLFSCLVDADYLDTEAFMQGQSPRLQEHPPMPELWQRLQKYIEKESFLQPKNQLNRQRAQALRSCIDSAEKPTGLYSLTLPTGAGKTVASLSFALRHAVEHGLDRVIYVIPYCSIIDQTVSVFEDILGKDAVLAHHGNVDYSDDNPRRLATENWDMPVVVTTAVQFFDSLYASKPGKCRKLHNIAKSVIIFDEVQNLPEHCLEPCIFAIGQLINHFGATALLCTATQPTLDDLFADLAPGTKRRELCPNIDELFNALKRVTFCHEGTLSAQQLAGRLQAMEQALCIVNTRKLAQELYGSLEGEGNFCLTTLLIPAHRSEKLAEIRRRLEAGLPCRVVATSLIEAGVDVDFPAVFREQAGLDSVLQAAGRCNREGKRTPQESLVTIFTTEYKPPRLLSAKIASFKETLLLTDKIDEPRAVNLYFKSLLSLNKEALDKFDVIKSFKKTMPFRTVSERFRLIDDSTKTVFIPCKENDSLLERLRYGEISRQELRTLGQYSLSLYPYQFQELCGLGILDLIDDFSGILLDPTQYSPDTGLTLSPEPAGMWSV